MNKGIKRIPKRQLAIVGNLLMNENVYSRKIRSSIKRKVPFISIREAESSPVVGAALMAIDAVKSS